MKLEWRIEKLAETKLIGKGTEMTFSKNSTRELWQDFMPHLGEIPNRLGKELYSVEIYKDPFFFQDYDTEKDYEKWAAVKVSSFEKVPGNFQQLTVPAGMYAVFLYKGKASQAEKTYKYIFGEWLPQSEFSLDARPHLAIMGENYKNEDPDSEEELWIPVKKK